MQVEVATGSLRGAVLFLILARWIAQFWLERLNRKSVMAHAGAIPEALKGVMDDETYRKSTAYTVAKGKLNQIATLLDTVLLVAILFSGILALLYRYSTAHFGNSAASLAAFLFVVALLFSLPALPLEWYAQFGLEERFGFNTMTGRTWIFDRLKGLALAVLLGYPLLVFILKLAQWAGDRWWFWAWAALIAFQFIVGLLAPVLILPLFNKFTPLPEGSLRDRLLKLAERTRFRARSIQVMDGSKRSRHSNAFFTGFGRFRKIVLFDTLVQQLAEPELESVLAHEIGHYQKKHLLRMLIASALTSLAGLYFLSKLVKRGWFFEAFGFESGNLAIAFLLFGLLAGLVSFWFSPVAHWWSRRYEFQADAYAREIMKTPDSLVAALRKLNELNLSNLTPHPLYSRFYYSHPTLLERERALLNGGQ